MVLDGSQRSIFAKTIFLDLKDAFTCLPFWPALHKYYFQTTSLVNLLLNPCRPTCSDDPCGRGLLSYAIGETHPHYS